MQSSATTVKEYIDTLPVDRKDIITKLRDTINAHIPAGFAEQMNYGMIGRVVPHSTYPQWYHVTPELPLPFLWLASQKNNISFYHMGLYADTKILDRFTQQYPKYAKNKLDMGKFCIRFKNMTDIPYDLIGELVSKITVAQWIQIYEQSLKR